MKNKHQSAHTHQANAGQAVYSKSTLSLYDFFVLGISNRFLWRCPTEQLLSHYNRHVTGNHLDVGVGTGYFLDHCKFPSGEPRLALMDMNKSSLAYAAHRVARYQPDSHQQNVLLPIETDIKKFDSIAINYLLHCLLGAITSKAVVFKHLQTLMNPGATLFGSTIVQGNAPRNGCAQQLMNFYNRKGIFSNQQDCLEDLRSELSQSFTSVEIKMIGCVALFSAQLVL
ncbi:MAG: class I SAM-dependent methyltransferase [Pseudomonadales bacterium]